VRADNKEAVVSKLQYKRTSVVVMNILETRKHTVIWTGPRAWVEAASNHDWPVGKAGLYVSK
jgi:hypothetical protein